MKDASTFDTFFTQPPDNTMLNHLIIALLTLVSAGSANADANPIFDPAPYTNWVATSTDGLSRKAVVSVPFVNSSGANDSVNLSRGPCRQCTAARLCARGAVRGGDLGAAQCEFA